MNPLEDKEAGQGMREGVKGERDRMQPSNGVFLLCALSDFAGKFVAAVVAKICMNECGRVQMHE